MELWEIKPGGRSPQHSHPEEHFCYILSGSGEYHGPEGSPVLPLREGAAFYIEPGEEHWVTNSGLFDLKVLVSTPLPGREPQAPREKKPVEKVMSRLKVVFDGGSRGNPGQGYGSFIIIAPGRKPHLVQREYEGQKTNNEAEYLTLLAALEYIITTLEQSERAPDQVELDIRGDSQLLIKQLKGEYKIKNAQLRELADSAHKLLRRFGKYELTWHEREESVALLGH